MYKLLLEISVVSIFSSCAGTLTHVHMLEDGGAIRTEEIVGQSYQYKVFIKNTQDFGWNGDRREDREKAVHLLYDDKCSKIEILEEAPLQTGTYPINRPAITWIMKIRCEK